MWSPSWCAFPSAAKRRGVAPQFIDQYDEGGYLDEFKRECLKMYVNGMGFRAIERVKGVHHTTVITWVKQVGELLPDAYDSEQIPQVGELDELQTFVGSKSGYEPASSHGARERAPRKQKSGYGQP